MEPSEGSKEGGTLLTITGKAFGTRKENIKVKVGGVPCAVQEVSTDGDVVKCITGKPTEADLNATVFAGKCHVYFRNLNLNLLRLKSG